jgi:hypothetical protein
MMAAELNSTSVQLVPYQEHITIPVIYDKIAFTAKKATAESHIFYISDNNMFDKKEYTQPNGVTYKNVMDTFVDITRENKEEATEGLLEIYNMGLFWMIPFETRFELAKEFGDNRELVRKLLIDTYAAHILDEKTKYPIYIIADPKYYLLHHLIPAITQLYNNVEEKETILYTFLEHINVYMYNEEMKDILLRVCDRFVRSHIRKMSYRRIVCAFALVLSKMGYKGYEGQLDRALINIMIESVKS